MTDFTIMSEPSGPLKTNCYLLYDNISKEAALFDVAGEVDKLLQAIAQEKLIVKYVFCTHLHFDHVLGIQAVREMFPDALLAFNEKEIEVMENMGMFARMFQFDPKSLGEVNVLIEDNQIFKLGDVEIKAILSPGHTPGSICYYFDEHLISGDVLFNRGVGRTDLYGGSFQDLEKSIQKLFTLPETTKVYPGHGDFTDIGSEKQDNPFVSSGSL